MAGLSGDKSAPGFNRFVVTQNDTSNYVRNIAIDAAGGFFVVNNATSNATRPALSAPTGGLVSPRQLARQTRNAPRAAADFWLTSLGPLGSVTHSGFPSAIGRMTDA